MTVFHEYPKMLPGGVVVQNAAEEKRALGGEELVEVKSAQGDSVSLPPAAPEPLPEPAPEPEKAPAKKSRKK